jgi:hypothetical protein
MKTLPLVFLVAACSASFSAAPLSPLHVSETGHFFVDEQNKPVFLLADTAWALVNQLKREEITEYLEHRRSQGFNAVAAVLYAPRNGDISKDFINAYGHKPFALHDGRPDPTRPLITAGNDPAKAAEYDEAPRLLRLRFALLGK